jgi:threonine dehydratase
MGRESKKATVNYTKRRGGKVVYKGKTDDPEKQAKEPTQQGKRFTIPATSFQVCRPATKKEQPDTE